MKKGGGGGREEKREFLQLDRVLAYHKRHDNNAAGEEHRISRPLRRDRKLWEVEKYLNMDEKSEYSFH